MAALLLISLCTISAGNALTLTQESSPSIEGYDDFPSAIRKRAQFPEGAAPTHRHLALVGEVATERTMDKTTLKKGATSQSQSTAAAPTEATNDENAAKADSPSETTKDEDASKADSPSEKTAAKTEQDTPRPVMKVVRLLQDMLENLAAQKADDDRDFEKKMCLCGENIQEYKESISKEEAKDTDLSAEISEYKAKLERYIEKRKDDKYKKNKDDQALTEATSLRAKEHKAFEGEKKDLSDSIEACKEAIKVLSKTHPKLIEVRSAVQLLQEGHVAQMAFHRMSLRKNQYDQLLAFMQDISSVPTFIEIPVHKSYAPVSAQVYGILLQMLEDFMKNLSEEKKTEIRQELAFTELKSAKERELKLDNNALTDDDEQISEFTEDEAEAVESKAGNAKKLKTDEKSLLDESVSCEEAKTLFAVRTKSRLAEMSAIQDAVSWVNSVDSFHLFDRVVRSEMQRPQFLQISSTSVGEDSAQRHQASLLLSRAAAEADDPQLALIAASLQLDAFTKVRKAMKKLMAELQTKADSENKRHETCKKNIADNERVTEDDKDEKTKLDAAVSKLRQKLTSIGDEIKDLKNTIATTKQQMRRKSETREQENSDAQEAILDHRTSQEILIKAKVRLQQVYTSLQEPDKHEDGNKAVRLLDTIINDSKTAEEKIETSEDAAQAAYEKFFINANDVLLRSSKSLVTKEEQKAKAEKALASSKRDLSETVTALEGLVEELADLHEDCDFLLKNFDVRQQARQAETDALKAASQVLKGAA